MCHCDDPLEALVAALRNGDTAAWGGFFSFFDSLIASVVGWSKWCFTPATREDIAQIVRAEIVRSMAHLRVDSQISMFVKRICINRCIDEVRRQVRERAVMKAPFVRDDNDGRDPPEVAAGERFDPRQAIADEERAAALRRALGAADITCRSAIEDFYLNCLSYKEMAEARGIAINTVGSRLAKCLEKLRQRLKNDLVFRELVDQL